ncbi:cyclic peptide export ABC transporter [Microseira wollei]|uniref:Cyclic peptide ABC transporter, ATP-binding protein n=1 Tax=Microseira wollei NIES-4236 TaxID=2530354 RepID=A0AAV3XN76_9CYAN|nr:cyclic peptide export ABC transporter [Microseira wollei]GET42236.1 cyclic peptide ABC transporter, ATP-binding protein [Microseira wollei NIES-4236]
MNVIWLLIKASGLNVAIAILTGLISGGCSAQLIALINLAVSGNSTDNLIGYFVGLAFLALLTSIISQFLLIDLAQGAVYNLRLRLSQGILSAPLRHLEELGANRLLATLTDDVQTLSNTVFVIPFLCIDFAIILGCLVYLSWLSGLVFVVTVACIGTAIAIVQILLNQMRKYFNLAREEQDRLFKHFRSITEGIKELKLHSERRQAFFYEELQVSVAASRNHNIAALRMGAIAIGWGQLLFFTIMALLVFALPKFVSVTPTLLAAYVLTLAYITTPMQNMLDRLPALFRANVALQKIEKMGLALADRSEEQSQNPQAKIHKPKSIDWTSLELEKVTHTYPGEKEDSNFVLGELNLTFYPGQLVFIVGGNGSGKSTLAKIITGLYIPETGEIKLNDRRITNENREWYRQHFSVVFSDFYLFERLLGISHPNLDMQAQDYLRQFHLDHKVQVKDGLISTTSLSQGQRKRLALLTAYLEDRPIYLFDEWASDQDPFFRDIFYKQLLPELKQRGKTVFVISHDDRYFHLADRLIKLDYGKIEYDR